MKSNKFNAFFKTIKLNKKRRSILFIKVYKGSNSYKNDDAAFNN